MKKFVISKMKKELMKANQEHELDNESGIIIILNNMEVYNNWVDAIKNGETKHNYSIIQYSPTIFKQLKEFKIYPSAIKKYMVDDKQNNNDEPSPLKIFLEKQKNLKEKRNE